MANSNNPFGDDPLYSMTNQSTPYYSTPDMAPSSFNTWSDVANKYGQIAVDFATQVFSGVGKRKREKEARKHQINMYNMQKADQRALIDEMNFYNSPSEQIKRLKDAGLSPHLFYGKGVTDHQASAGTPPLLHDYNPLSSPLSFLTEQKSFLELEYLAEQVREKRIQNDISEQTKEDTVKTASLNREALEKNMAVIENAVTSGHYDIALKSLEYEVKSDPNVGMKQVSAIQYALLEFDKKYKDATYSINVDQLQTVLDTAKLDKQLKNELLEVAKIHTSMWQKGISPNDPAFERALSGALNSLLDEKSEVGRAVYGTLDKLPFGNLLLKLIKK